MNATCCSLAGLLVGAVLAHLVLEYSGRLRSRAEQRAYQHLLDHGRSRCPTCQRPRLGDEDLICLDCGTCGLTVTHKVDHLPEEEPDVFSRN